MVIDANTKIAALIKANPAAIDAIASINAHFKKLQNPVLRKIFASRVTIADAAKIGKCDIETFFTKLRPLGFAIGESKPINKDRAPIDTTADISYDMLLDVREDISSGNDPFRKIMQAIAELPKGKVLLLINSFEPRPLIGILKDRGYTSEVVEVGTDEVHTYLKKTTNEAISTDDRLTEESQFDEIKDRFNSRLQYIDVRQLPMPQPMVTILKALDSLESNTALYVYHKKVPLFLLPELKERSYQNVIKHTNEGVELIIYRQDNAA
ncbi:DUF2249 domain-containing protein [Polluticoccus soli]|uniref:DUF2249 domain-containing protein n=1 Tax=Polluticoccus soli TaxID=3034150 RepID=UPI0023E1F209|nr:DUF2249 domain-containing protein [Flavipsychrobacter sp. JY13-12]